MSEPSWIELDLAFATHDWLLADHGGMIGVQDRLELDSALASPRKRWAYGTRQCCTLAATYAFDIAQNCPFVDGNERTGWVLARLFLESNGISISFNPSDAERIILELAEADYDVEQLGNWFERHCMSVPADCCQECPREERSNESV